MRMQVKLEIGHKASCRQEMTQEGYTHDWTVFVRGSEGKDISHFVEKVVFHLHESFPRPKRAVKEPPFKLEERGYGSFELKIEVCFKTRDEPRKVMFNYDLFLPLMDYPPVSNVRTEALTFTHPTEEFMRKLIKGGGLQISASNGVGSDGVSNGHGNTSRDESKEVAQKSANVPDISDKGKKPKLPKPSSKTAPAAVTGGKRSSPSLDHAPADVTAKKKKKVSENSTSLSKGKHSVPVANDRAAVPLTTEVKDLKVKIKPVPPKEPEKKTKEPGLASNHKGKVPTHSSKGKEVKSHTTAAAENASAGSESAKGEPTIEHKTKLKKKGEKTEKRSRSDKKEKKDKEKKDKEKKDKEKKDKEKKDKEKKDKENKDKEKKDQEKREKEKKTIEKVLIRRSSGDSWASSGSSSGLLSNVMSKNKALGKLLSEISDDEDGGENLPTPFKRETSPVPLKNSPKTVIKEPVTIATEKAASLNSSKHKPKENKARLNHSNGNSSEINVHNTIKENCTSGIEADITKKSTSGIEVDATKKSTSGIDVDITKKSTVSIEVDVTKNSTSGIEVDITKKSTSSIEADITKKSTDDVKNRSPAKSEEKNGLSGLSKKELYDLYDQIMSCQDSDSLQNVVDIIESTGLYKVSDKTFEFDLCCLEKTTLRKIQKCLA